MLSVGLGLHVVAPRGPKGSTCSKVPVPCADQLFASESGLCSCSLEFYWLYIIIKNGIMSFSLHPQLGSVCGSHSVPISVMNFPGHHGRAAQNCSGKQQLG